MIINDEAFAYFSDTVGVCMKSDLPQCLSHRERLFIVNTMVKDFKEIFKYQRYEYKGATVKPKKVKYLETKKVRAKVSQEIE